MIPFTIRRLSSFEKLFTKLARKAVKLGLPAPSFRVIGERQEKAEVFAMSEGERVKEGEEMVVVRDIEITGLDPVKLDGWNFAAMLECVRGSDNLIFAAPGAEVPARFSSTGCACEHCNINRQRNKAFVVRHAATGEFKQVGSTCLADFLGCNSAESVAALFAFYGEIVHDLDALRSCESAGWEGGNAAYDLREVAARAIVVSDKLGWRSRTKAREQGGIATADVVKMAKSDEYPVTDEARAKADEAISYFATLPESEAADNELGRNLRVLANAGFCSGKSHSLACALWVCYQVALTKKDRAEKDAARIARSQFFGKPGERVKGIKATVFAVFSYDTDYGTQWKTIMEDENGNVLVGKDLGAERGDTVIFTATVKEHTIYRECKQTVLLRAKVQEVIPAPALAA